MPGRGCGVEDRPRGRSAAEQDGVQFGQRGRGGRVGERFDQLGGDQRRVSPPSAQSADGGAGIRRCGNPRTRPARPASEPASRLRTSTWTPAMWCGGKASSQLPGPPRRSWVARALAVSAAAVSRAPLGAPVVPEVVTTRATSSSIGSPIRSAASSDASSGDDRDERGITAGQHPFQCGQQHCGGGAGWDVERPQSGYAWALAVELVVLVVVRIVQWPALGGQPRSDPLDVGFRRAARR